jgi:hypothetical protein
MKTPLRVAAVLLGACSAEPMTPDSGNIPDSGPPLTWADACANLVGPQCATYQQCQPERFASQYVSQPSCVQIRTAQCLEARQAPGNTATPDMLAACAAQIGALTCDAYPAFNDYPLRAEYDACRFTGTLAEGSPCIDDGQCASGACGHVRNDACGSCLSPDATKPCFLNADCPGKQVCRYNLCADLGELDAGCNSTNICRSSLTCRNGHCETRALEGASCDTTLQDCAANLYCTSQGCVRAQLKVMGDRCGIESDGSWFLCGAGLRCIFSATLGHNECVSTQDAGVPCAFGSECAPGLSCLEQTCALATAAACTEPANDTPNTAYPAHLPDVPQVIARAMPADVLGMPKVVSVTFPADAYADTYDQLLAGLGSTSWWPATTQEYGVGPLVALPPRHMPSPPPNPVADAQIRGWLAGNIDAGTLPAPDGSTLYMLFIPDGTVVTKGSASSPETSCKDFFGYHSQTVVAGARTPYAVIPRCLLQPMTSTLTHELAEAVTDPFQLPDGGNRTGYDFIDSDHRVWVAFGDTEVGDLCEDLPVPRFPSPELGQQVVQRTWSNRSMAAFHTPCVPALPGQPFFAAVPDTPDTVSITLNSSAVPTRGISIGVGATRTVPVSMLSDGPVDGPWHVSAYDHGTWKGSAPLLRFSFDRQYGLNGDVLLLTITVLAQDSTLLSEPFVLVSHRGRVTHYWFSIVGNP